MTALRNHLFKRHRNRMIQIRRFDETIVYINKLFPSCLLRKFRLTGKAVNVQRVAFFFYRYNLLGIIISEQGNNSLFKISRFQMIHFVIIIEKLKADFRMRQCNALKLFNNIFQFNRIAFQKISSRGNIEEKILHGNGSSFFCLTGLLFQHFHSFNLN